MACLDEVFGKEEDWASPEEGSSQYKGIAGVADQEKPGMKRGRGRGEGWGEDDNNKENKGTFRQCFYVVLQRCVVL